MRLYNIYGNLIKRNVSKYRIDWDKPSRSKIQFKVKQFLKPYWFGHVVYEEFPVYGYNRMKVDILNATLKVAIEVHGSQHTKFNKHFHNNSVNTFCESLKRDVIKYNWLIKNSFKVLEIEEKEVKQLSEEFFKKEFDFIL